MSSPAVVDLVPGSTTLLDLSLIGDHHDGKAYVTLQRDVLLESKISAVSRPTMSAVDDIQGDLNRLRSDISVIQNAIAMLTVGLKECNAAIKDLDSMLQCVQRPVIQYEPQF